MRGLRGGDIVTVEFENETYEFNIKQAIKNNDTPETLAVKGENFLNARLESPFRCQIHVVSIDPLDYMIRVFHYVPRTGEFVDGEVVVTEHPEPDKAEWVASFA
jgi:hypothetical protein